MRRSPFAAALILWTSAAAAQYVDPSLRWRTLDSEHFSVHFAEPLRARAQIVASTAESVYPRVTGLLGWRPESRAATPSAPSGRCAAASLPGTSFSF